MDCKINSTKKVCYEMMSSRGYDIDINDVNDDQIIFTNSCNKQIIVFFCSLQKLNINSIKEYIKLIEEKELNHAIIIYLNIITSSAKKVVENLYNVTIELFTSDELQFNITEHSIVPTHIQLSDAEDAEFKTKYGIKIPVIMKTDPISRYYNFTRGKIIKIIRYNNSISYRIVK